MLYPCLSFIERQTDCLSFMETDCTIFVYLAREHTALHGVSFMLKHIGAPKFNIIACKILVKHQVEEVREF